MTAEYDITRKSYKYSIDDWQLLVNILREYGDKLTGLSQKISIEKNRYRVESSSARARIRVVLYTALFLVSSLVLFVLTTKSFLTTDRHFLLLYTTFGVFCLAISTMLSIVFRDRREDSDTPIYLIEMAASRISSRLESAIRLTITVSDQVEISLAKKLEMDLRIDEARSALDYYYSVVGISAEKAS
jgi:hypothetical protein